MDGPEDLKDGSVLGVKNAAVRKLLHELGIPIGELKVRVCVHVRRRDLFFCVWCKFGTHDMHIILYSQCMYKIVLLFIMHIITLFFLDDTNNKNRSKNSSS